jgi:hypothetical protein
VSKTSVLIPLKSSYQGFDYELYTVQFESDGVVQYTYIYAVSEMHAQLLIEDMKGSLKLVGRLDDAINI